MSDDRDIRKRMQPAVLSDWSDVGPGLVVFGLRCPDGGPFFDFEPGQYVQLASWRQPDDAKPRAYSIASAPHQAERLEFYAVLIGDASEDDEDAGSFTMVLWHLEVGDDVLYMGPAGRFTLERSRQPEVVLVATGTGLAPFMSMLREAWHRHREDDDGGRRFTLLHGVSHVSDLGYRQELERMAADPSFGFLYVPAISRPDEATDRRSMAHGRVNDVVRLLLGRGPSGQAGVEPQLPIGPLVDELRRRLARERAAVYLCGNPSMIGDSKHVLAEAGYEDEGEDRQVFTEDYW